MKAFQDPERRRNLVERAISALILLPIAIWLTVVGGWPFALLVAVAAVLCAVELLLMAGPLAAGEGYGVAVAGAFPLLAAVAPAGALLPGWAGLALAGATVGLLSVLLLRHEVMEQVPARAGRVALAWAYCGLLPATVVGLRLRFGFDWVILAFVVTWANDTFAYFAGLLFGRHKLYEKVSPKKTWEGFAGGALGSLAGAAAMQAFRLQAELPLGGALALGAGAAVLGPLGDLVESLLKRASGVKDSGRLIPGHGGLLDRIDALLFVAPWVYVFASYLR
ncbi:MAG TPA: phosphatidate cytidylyltransferase [Anaeromyxobacteraceae bacterium]|nr:phosphatidate cytidylyltransferase [Anaeromyxobacteraceae bacterium]